MSVDSRCEEAYRLLDDSPNYSIPRTVGIRAPLGKKAAACAVCGGTFFHKSFRAPGKCPRCKKSVTRRNRKKELGNRRRKLSGRLGSHFMKRLKAAA